MKNIFFLFFLSLCIWACQAKKTTISSKSFNIKRKILSVRENSEVFILISDNNDVIEVFKENESLKCTNIILGKSYKFRVLAVSDLIQHGISSPSEYILNDSTTIKYNSYYTAEENKNICIQ